MSPRFKIETGDVPPAVAAKYMGMSAAEFELKLPDLLKRKFPPPDPTTGNFDYDAMKAWRKARHADLFPQEQNPNLQPSARAGDADTTRARLRAVSGG